MQNVFIRTRGNKHVLFLKYRDNDGKVKQKSLGSYDKISDAKKALVQEKNKLLTGDFVIPKNITVESYILGWLEKHKINLSITTYNRYKDIITRHINPNIGSIPLQKLNPLIIEKFYTDMLKTLSGKTVLQYHRLLSKALDKAYKMQLINKNPTELVEAPKVKKYIAKALDVDEMRLLIKTVSDTRLEVPVNLALALGLRAGEILGLSWDAINFKNNTITINQTLVRDTKGFQFKEPKSDTSNRVITAPLGLIELLKKHKREQLEFQLKSKGKFNNEYNLVFTQVNGSPMNSQSFSRLFRDFLKKHDLPLVRFHDLRHTNATLMLATDTSAKVASNRLGHSSIGITMDLYTHVIQSLDYDAAEKLNRIIYSQNIN